MVRLISFILLFSSCAQLEKFNQQAGKVLEKPRPSHEVFKVRWVKNLDPDHSTGNFPIGTSSPFIFEDILYMGSLEGEMRAYDVESGRVLWQAKENGPIQSQVNKNGDYIFYGTKLGRLVVRHYYTGKLKYSVDLGSPIESQAAFLQGRVIYHLRNHSIIVLDATTGKVFWRYKRSVAYSTTLQRVSHIQAYQGGILVGFADGNVALLTLEEGVLKWEQKISTGVKFVDVDVKPLVLGDYIVAGSAAGPMRFLNPANGVIEKTIELVQSHVPYRELDNIIVGATNGRLHRVSEEGKILNSRAISDDAISSVVPWKNNYIVTTMGSMIYYVDKEDFQIIDKFDLGSVQSAVFGEAVIGEDGILSVYSSRNRLYVFK